MLTLTGNPYERGRQHGKARSEQIRHRATATLAHLGESHLASDHVWMLQTRASSWWTAIKAASLDIAAEIRGIAFGAGQPLPVIVLLNAFEAFDLTAQVELGGCTTVGISTNQGAYVGQNWDANPLLAATAEIHHHIDPDGIDVVVLASPGGLGWIGMNQHGVALVNNDLLTRGMAVGVPSQVVRRMMLQQRGAVAAANILKSFSPVGGRAYTIGDSDGDVVSIEVAAEEPSPRIGRGSAIHTNHALEPDISQWEETKVVAEIYPSTYRRYERAAALLNQGGAGTAAVRRILTDHRHRPLSVCRHPAPEEPTVTAASAIFECRRRTAHIAIGNPCEARYQTLVL